jgi:hypothetical protein
MKKNLLCPAVIIMLSLGSQLFGGGLATRADTVSDSGKKVYFTIRFGKGGFKDHRSEIGRLGGGQLALDIRHGRLPIALTLSTEYYSNGPDPTHPYELDYLAAMNISYSEYLLRNQRLNLFAGGGTGWMVVPQGTDPEVTAMLFDIEAGVQAKLLWKFGIYGVYKYLYAHKGSYVDFSEHIILLGINFTFGL